MAKLVVNELLCFITFYHDKLDRNSLFSFISEFYSHDEAVSAKLLLIAECDKLRLSKDIADFKKKRLNTKEDALQKVSKDILDIWEVIDCQRGGNTETTFVAADPSRLPAIEAQKIDDIGFASVVSQLQHQVSNIINIVTRIDKRVENAGVGHANLNDSFCSTDRHPQSPRTLPVTPANSKDDIISSLRKSRFSARRRLDSTVPPFIPSEDATSADVAQEQAAPKDGTPVSEHVTPEHVATEDAALHHVVEPIYEASSLALSTSTPTLASTTSTLRQPSYS